MAYTFFYVSVVITIVGFLVIAKVKPLRLGNVMIGIASVGYSIAFDVIFGDYFGLYYYIAPPVSPLYMVLSAILVYSLMNITYTLFLPRGTKLVLIYTLVWIVGMLVFEYASIKIKTVVFTGWRPVPWSPITYVVTYAWINYLYRYAERRGGNKRLAGA